MLFTVAAKKLTTFVKSNPIKKAKKEKRESATCFCHIIHQLSDSACSAPPKLLGQRDLRPVLDSSLLKN